MNIFLVKSYLNKPWKSVGSDKCAVLLLIPVIREQKVIQQTLNHFLSMNIDGVDLYIAIAGTSREVKREGALTTREVVEQWINAHPVSKTNIKEVFFCEVNEEKGDRATQLNYAVNCFHNKHDKDELDFVGVYDADSLPSTRTIQEVRSIFAEKGYIAACQQPVHFIKAANRMAKDNLNPLLVANALYQTTWTVIRELPSWVRYSLTSSNTMFHENVYLIGHGEFIRYETYKSFKFPEFEVTDGIQLGYRLGMSNKKISPLREFCDDDVPQSLLQLINQHKRWFGGCMNLYDAYKWSYEHFGTKAICQLIDGYWSQACWAWASISMLIALMLSLYIGNFMLSLAVALLIVIYTYLLPVFAHMVLPAETHVRMIDWLVLPISIFIKCIGPNWFILEKLLKKNVTFKKVER